MTRQRDLKNRIRERMRKTGERYTTARTHLINQRSVPRSGPRVAGALDGYTQFGGIQRDTGALRNVLEHSGITASHNDKPFTETFLNGVCGGVGFGYFVFEYKGWPPMLTMTMRPTTMPDTFLSGGLERLGVNVTRSETTGTKAAERALRESLGAGRAALCMVDAASLPQYGIPQQWAGMGPQIVGVAGLENDTVLLDDRARHAIPMAMDQLQKARARYRKGKNLLITVEPASRSIDTVDLIRASIRFTIKCYREAPYKNFASSFGFAGMEKFADMLVDEKNAKGWSKVFGKGGALYAGMRRTYDCIEIEYTPPAGGRPLYADFLDEAASITGVERIGQAARDFRESGRIWSDLSALIVTRSDPAIQRGCEISDRCEELRDTGDRNKARELARLWQERWDLGDSCTMAPETARECFREMADLVKQVVAAEQRAVHHLEHAVSH